MRKSLCFFNAIALLALLASCDPFAFGKSESSSKKESGFSSSLFSYSETESRDLGTCVVYQISDAFSAKAFSSVEAKPGWRFDGLPLFFESGCPLGRDVLLSLAVSYGLSGNAESSAYECQGTAFLSYTSRKIADGETTFTISDDAEGRLAVCYVAKLRKRVFASTGNSFSVYEALEVPYLDCRTV